MIISIIAPMLQFLCFVYFCRVGFRVAPRLAAYSRWLPLALGAALVVGPLLCVAIFDRQLVGVPLLLLFCCVGLAGGILVRSEELREAECG